MNLNQPSRELDAWIAEHVMGWKWSAAIAVDGEEGPVRFLVPADALSPYRPYEGSGSEFFLGTRFVPHYGGDIAYAWKVVEEMMAKYSHEFALEFGWAKHPIFAWHCHVGFVDVVASTPAFAICKAAYMVFVGDMEDME